MRRILCILTITAIVLIGTVAASPVLPNEFYGSVYLNGNPAPAGTVIIAMMNGAPHGNFTTTVDGLYGSPDNFNPRLIVSVPEEELSTGNMSITFLVGGVQAFQTVPFSSGNSVRLDLFANTQAFNTPVTTYSSSVGSSGGSGGYTSGGSVSSGSGIGISSSVQGTALATVIPTTGSRSSIYYDTNVSQTTSAPTVIATTVTTPSPVVTAVPTTKKAGIGPLSIVALILSLIAVFCILDRSDYIRKKR